MSKAVCGQCYGMMESKHRHDFVRCACGKSFLDGGDDYFRAGGYTIGVPDDYEEGMTAEEFFAYLDKLDKEQDWLEEPELVERPKDDSNKDS
jgi:hypothetical protein